MNLSIDAFMLKKGDYQKVKNKQATERGKTTLAFAHFSQAASTTHLYFTKPSKQTCPTQSSQVR